MKIFIYDENRVLMRTVGTPDIMQGENNATLIFMSVAGIDESNFQDYLAQFAATIGTSHPADIITDFGTYVLDGVEYKGWKYFVSSKFTQVAGALNANLILSSGGSTLISQTVTLNVNPSASGQTWNQNIDLAKWYQLLAYTIGLKNPKVGVIADSYLDTYNSEGQAGSYFYFGEDGVPHLLFVGYNEDDDLVAQTDYYSDGGAMYCRSRTFSDGEWTEWETSDQASAISVNVSGLPQLTGANTVQKAIAALAHAVYPIAFVTSLTPSPFTSVDVPNSKDKIIKDDLGQDLNVGRVLDYAFAIFGRYNTHAFDFDNTLIMTSDGAIYRMKYENGSMVAHWFNGSPAQAKAEQALINQSLSDGVATNNNLIKHSVVGNSAMTMDPDTYVITITNYSLSGEVLSTYKVDIPAEMAFVGASYDNTTKDLTFTLQNGDEVAVPLDDIVSGLASEAWVNTAIANALLPYATTSWVDSNYMSLTKGGMVDLAEDPATANTHYFGAKHGTKSFHQISDNAYAYRVSDNDGNLVQHNANKNGGVSWLKTANGVSTVTKVPFKSTTGTHDLAFQEDLDEANAKITALESKTAKQESDIQYLYRQVIGGGDLVTETDSGVSLTSQNFPLTVSPKALLNYVGGMCQKVGESIITAPVTKVVSKGFNLWDEETIVTAGHLESKNFCECYPNTDYYVCGPTISPQLLGNGFMFYDKDKSLIKTTYPQAGSIAKSPENARYFKIGLSANYGTTYNHDICINVSDASLNGTYMPYRAPIEYPIPAEVRALEGYGWGFNADCNNHASYERKKNVKMVARVDLGSLNYSFNTGNMYYTSGLSSTIKKPNANTDVVNAKCATYDIVAYYSHSGSSDMKISVSAEGTLYITNANATDAENLKTLLSGIYLYYELAAPVETDISEYIDSDVIEVSAGGHLEFENENDMGVPYSATYQCEPETQEGE